MTTVDTDKTLVANWLEREDVETLLGREITKAEYQEIVEDWKRKEGRSYRQGQETHNRGA